MIQCGIGVGVGWGGGSFSEAASAALLKSLLGATLIGDWIAADAVFDGSLNCTSFPEHWGIATLTPGPSSSGAFARSVTNGRTSLLANTSATKGLFVSTGFTAKSIVSVADTPTFPTAAQYGLAHPAGNEAALLVTNEASAWFTGHGWTHRRDGVDTENLATGVHVYQGTDATNTVEGLEIGRWALDGCYPVAMLRFLVLSADPDAATRAEMVRILKLTYSIVPV